MEWGVTLNTDNLLADTAQSGQAQAYRLAFAAVRSRTAWHNDECSRRNPGGESLKEKTSEVCLPTRRHGLLGKRNPAARISKRDFPSPFTSMRLLPKQRNRFHAVSRFKGTGLLPRSQRMCRSMRAHILSLMLRQTTIVSPI